MRLPSQGMCDGSPPKLQGHDIVQLQLSATVADIFHEGCRAPDGTASASTRIVARARVVRMGTAYTDSACRQHPPFTSCASEAWRLPSMSIATKNAGAPLYPRASSA